MTKTSQKLSKIEKINLKWLSMIERVALSPVVIVSDSIYVAQPSVSAKNQLLHLTRTSRKL